MPSLLNETYYKNYSAPLLSCASFVSLILFVLLIILPYFLADYSGGKWLDHIYIISLGFWKDTSVFFEQPNVTYNDQMILYVLEDSNMKYFSSMLPLNNYYSENLLNIPMVKYEDFDINYDRLIDQYLFKINFYTNPGKIRNIKLLFLFDYTLTTRVQGTIQTLAVVDIDTPLGASYVRAEGELRIKQKGPLNINTLTTGNYNEDIFKSRTPIEYDELLDAFRDRRVSTVFDYDKVVIPMKHDQITQLEIIVNIPSFEEYTVEVPSFTQLKFAWIQYLTMFIPIAFAIYSIKVYILTNRIFQCTTVSDLPKFR